MSKWTDASGRTWRIEINMWTCRQVKKESGWDLPNIFNDGKGAKLAELLGDPFEMLSVLLVLVSPQLKEHDCTDEDFGRTLCGDVFLNAIEAFKTALTDFFPEHQANLLRKVFAAEKEVSASLVEKANETLDQVDISMLTKRALSMQESVA